MQHGSSRGLFLKAAVVALAGLASGAAPAAGLGADHPEWTHPHKPFRIFGNTYYVGTDGLSAILVTSEFGHVLIDGGLPQNAPLIRASIEALGFSITDVKAILNSHVHPDHAGGIAELQRLSGADVYALRPANEVLATGKASPEDPQAAGKGMDIPKVSRVWVAQDDQQLGVGSIRLRVIATPGHTPGGATWTWESCEGSRCLKMVYADSLSAVSAGKYRFSDHPEVVQQFQTAFQRLEALPCDVLVTPHPEQSRVFERLDRGSANTDAVKDPEGCRKYVATAREGLATRLESEKKK